MKKLTILFSVLFFLSGCSCMLGQIPAQYIFVGENCSAVLPSYLDRVTATDNCVLASLIQTPAAGTVLTSAMMVNRVEIKATDNSGNSSSVSFDVVLIDTIPPVLTVDSVLITGDFEILATLYNQADRIIADKLAVWDATFPYASLGLPVQDSTYYKEYLISTASPGYAVTGKGGRVWQFWNLTDTI
jgi:hypothetical protein